MKALFSGTALIVFFHALFSHAVGISAFAVDESMPYGRVCLTVRDGAEKTEAPFEGDSKPGPGRSLQAYLDSNGKTACFAIVAAFLKSSGALANGWRPVFVDLGSDGFEEKKVPLGGERWGWERPAEAFEVFAVFIPKGAQGTEKARELVAKLQDPGAPAAVAKLQARQLREELLRIAAIQTSGAAQPTGEPVKIGGTVRGEGDFPWLKHARSISFTDGRAGLSIFRYGGG
ncbi:MAG: hypothetical protein RLZZ244_962 [Verrucomicrobiota bacterium]|jgi:hypothetical protein